MKLALLALVCLLTAAAVPATRPEAGARLTTEPSLTTTSPVRFAVVDVFVDAGDAPLAAYQFELRATTHNVALTGIEGGEHAAFGRPPYYDPKALLEERIVIAAFNTGADLPRGKTRVARLHVQVTGDVEPAYDAKLQVAASTDAKQIPATISVTEGAGQ